MKNAKCFDIHDTDVTPAIYNLLFSDAYVELTGNDTWYKISPFGDGGFEDGWKPHKTDWNDTEKSFKDRINRGYKNCYYDTARMKEFYENPCSCEEAVKQFKQWLIDKGVTNEDKLFVKIWW